LRNESINTLKSLEILEASKYSYKSIWSNSYCSGLFSSR
jgi:hypothetical protein